MNIYDVIVVLNPTPNEADDGKEPVVIQESRIHAQSEQVALLLAGRKLDAILMNRELGDVPAGRLEVRLRPFAASR